MSQFREITCKDCQETFEFSEGEQKHFQKLGFPDPIRCKDCRAARKARKSPAQSDYPRA